MNSYSVVQFVTLIVYFVLAAMVMRDTRTGVRKLFLVYLLASIGWSFSSFMMHSNSLPEQLSIWGKLLPVTAIWAIIAYSHFICRFVHKSAGRWIGLGYAFLAVLVVLVVAGYIPEGVTYLGNGVVAIEYGQWLYLIGAGTACFMGLPAFLLIRRYRALKDPVSRNRVVYPLVGVSLMVVFGSLILTYPEPRFPFDHLGHLANALLLSYAILRHKLLDIKLVLRKGLTYSSISAFITTTFLLILLGLHSILQTWTSSASLAVIIVTAFLIAWIFNPLRILIQRAVDRMFYGESYDYRQMVLSFAQRMNNVLDLDELAEAMLKPIAKSVNATQVSLLLSSNSDFTSQFAERLIEEEPVIPIKLSNDSQIVNWLIKHDKPLSRELIDIAPEFKGLWEVERDIIDAVEMELLLPMKSKGNLVGILALSRKESGGLYSSDDTDLLVTLVNEAAVAIDNAQLYAQARERAHVDELTGLYNHRYFQERLDEEISRCVRFGDIFSLLFLDLDLFKIYNDVYGHVAGDAILKQIGQHIEISIRGIDMAFRYGGDEFTIILPQASLDDAYNVSERIRKKVESEMDSQGVALTCSVGIASWPTDGVMREELLKAADTALYYSKQAGRNRINAASDITSRQTRQMEDKMVRDSGVLSTIYALAATVDAKDHYTYGHSKKVSKYSTAIAEALGYNEDRIATIRAAALLHDIGKIGVSDSVLAKVGTLDADDWDIIRTHPKLGVAILKHVDGLSGCLAAIQYHHEHYDGSGYPSGLKGANIPLDARILTAADAYDAMTSLRPYRDHKLSQEQAFEELRRCAGTQFDPEIIEIFIAQETDQQPKRKKPKQAPIAIHSGGD